MKRLALYKSFFTLFIFCSPVWMLAQSAIEIINTENSTYLVNNTPKAYFTIRFDSIDVRKTEAPDVYRINNRSVGIYTYDIATDNFHIRLNWDEEDALFKNYMIDELKILKELEGHKIESEYEQFVVLHQKKFFLWHAQLQTQKEYKKERKKLYKRKLLGHMADSISHFVFLNFSSNQKLVSIRYPIYWDDDFNTELNRMKTWASKVNIYGFPIHTQALLNQQLKAEKQELFWVLDRINGVRIFIPPWVNICKYGRNGMLFTMPEVKNRKGIVNVQWEAKKESESFSKYIYAKLGNKEVLNMRIMNQPIINRGMYYEVNLTNGRKAIYVFMENEKTNLWINYNATTTTYKLDIPKFREFITGIEFN